MDCDTSFENFANLVNILKFTGALLKNSFGKEVYNSVEVNLIVVGSNGIIIVIFIFAFAL